MEAFMREAIQLAQHSVRENQGGPFGAVIVKDNKIIGRGNNQVLINCDPTAHAEIVAIRAASQALQQFHLTDCILFTSCEPCPMCLGAIYWSRLARVIYAADREDAKNIGFNDDYIYQEFNKALAKRSIPIQGFMREQALAVFTEWQQQADKKLY